MGQLLISHQDEQYGNHTYFTFYTEFNKTLEVKVVETIFLSLVFVFSWLSNVCAIVLLIRKKRLVTSNCFVLNLFCSDLLFVSMIPFILVVRWTENWILGEFVCHMLFYVMSLSGSVILISLSAVSLERMICIMKVTQTTTCNVKVVVLGLVIIWAFSAMTALPLCFFFKVIPKTVNDEGHRHAVTEKEKAFLKLLWKRTIVYTGLACCSVYSTLYWKHLNSIIWRGDEQELKICTLLWPTLTEEITWDVSFVLLDFIIPGLGIIVSYTKIYKITRDIRQRMISSTAYSENHQIRVSQRDYKLFRTLFILMISFFVMWTPVFIMVLLLLFQNLDIGFRLSPTCFFWISLFTFCNSIVNPVLYNINLCRQKWCQIVFCCSPEETTDTETTIKKNENQNGDSEIK